MPQFESSFFSSLIFWEVVSFGILFFVLYKFAFPGILAILEEREKKIKDSLDQAERHRAESERTLKEYEAKLSAAAKERRKAIADIRNQTTELALMVAEKVVQRSLTDADHKKFADEALTALSKSHS
jgi:F-type H+-transporting ATPase subunit b